MDISTKRREPKGSPQINKEGGTHMLKITFQYADEMSHWEWRTQTCVMSSVEECKKVYGLGVDCEYRIISVEEV